MSDEIDELKLTALSDPDVERVLQRIRAEQIPIVQRLRRDGLLDAIDPDPSVYIDAALTIGSEGGQLVYLMARMLRARRVVDFATSLGVSTIFLAAAVRDNGGGVVVGAELLPDKARATRENVADAGLAEFVEIREGDARETLRDVGGDVDFAVIDGFPTGEEPSVSRAVLEVLRPQLRPGAALVNDNGEQDYLAYVRDPRNGFSSAPLGDRGELSVFTGLR